MHQTTVRGDEGDKQGSGGGGASFVWPLGHIEIRDGHSEFKPYITPASPRSSWQRR